MFQVEHVVNGDGLSGWSDESIALGSFNSSHSMIEKMHVA